MTQQVPTPPKPGVIAPFAEQGRARHPASTANSWLICASVRRRLPR